MRYIILLSMLFSFHTIMAQNFFKDFFKTAAPATAIDTIISLEAPDQQNAGIPLTLIKGTQAGPTFAVIAGIHGMEYPTIVSLLELKQEIDPAKLKGNLVIIPIVNQAAFFKRVPFLNPADSLNLNRVFPGAKDGSITQVMADFMTTKLYPAIDILLDMHGGDVGEDLIPFICYYDNKEFKQQTEQAAQLSLASGFKRIVVYPYQLTTTQPAMYAFKQAVRQGITAFSIEIGKLGALSTQEVQETKTAVFRIMETLNMYTTGLKPIHQKPIYYTQQFYIPVPVQGIFYSSIKAGDQVQKGAVLGTIKDVFGNLLAEIKAPESGIVLYKTGTPPVNVGETLFCIGRE